MPKVKKILLITCFSVITSYAKSNPGFTSAPPDLLLYVKTDNSATLRQLHRTEFSPAKYTHATHKITQSTKKINTTLVRKEALLLIHLTSDSNQIVIRVTDNQGKALSAVQYPEMEAGFYELPVLPSTRRPQLYFVSLIINHQTYSFQISPN